LGAFQHKLRPILGNDGRARGALIKNMALKKGIRRISLEVIDTNPRAEALYRRLGFTVVKQRTLRLLNFFFKFSFKSSSLMIKGIN
jgi:RimJ/RimL family protein N-acetyltransferase